MSQVNVLSGSCWPHGQDKISTFGILQTLAAWFKKENKGLNIACIKKIYNWQVPDTNLASDFCIYT